MYLYLAGAIANNVKVVFVRYVPSRHTLEYLRENSVKNSHMLRVSKALTSCSSGIIIIIICSTGNLRNMAAGSRFMPSPSFLLVGLVLLLGASKNNQSARAANIDGIDPDLLVWEARSGFPGGEVHHPITFANATHGFVFSGSTYTDSYTSFLWVYEAATDSWTDLSETEYAFPGLKRSYGYGVASTTDCSNSKAYLGFGAGENSARLSDWWEFDMSTLSWRQLADFPGLGRRHPAMNFVEPLGEIHVGLGDGLLGNYNDYWSYNIERDEWRQLDDFPSSRRHHPFYFAIDMDSYVGLGHSDGSEPYIEKDWYRYDALEETWSREEDFASYALGMLDSPPVTTEGRVAGTQFSVAGSCSSDQTLGFVLSGDGDNHGTMPTGEFHVFDPEDNSIWHSLPPHPGPSRWAPGSFVLQGSSTAFLLGGYDRQQRILFSDLWSIDLEPLFDEAETLMDDDNATVLEGELSESSSAQRFRDLVSLIVAISPLTVLLYTSL